MNFIDLFAGASGMSEGFIKAGFNPIAHVEMNTDACFTIKTRAAFHYLSKFDKLELYNDYLLGKITRDQLYCHIPENLLSSVINKEITDQTITTIFTEIQNLSKKKKIDLIINIRKIINIRAKEEKLNF